ncbi:MAG: D-allose ABC transporter permease [Lachnospiraceae bacterium]|nr:D-allose ABC transporter permease [Lachnospiraceae bacterium]
MSKQTQTVKPKKTFSDYWSSYSTVAILVLMLIVFSALKPSAFLSTNNFVKIIEQSSITILLACGEFFGIILGGIDLSVSSTMALSGVVCAKLMLAGWPPVLAVLVGIILFGAVVGAINGSLINLTNLPPFIITLGTQAIFRGFTYILSDARSVSGISTGFMQFVGGKLGGVVPMPIVIALIVALILIFFTTKTRAGRNIYALGGNPSSAYYAGITTKRHQLLCFVISGVCASLAGMVNIARLGSAEPNAGTGYETYAIASVIIGGASFFGGQGVVWKVVIGGLIIGVINNGLNMVGLSSYYQQIAMGALIILAVTLDRFFGASKDK